MHKTLEIIRIFRDSMSVSVTITRKYGGFRVKTSILKRLWKCKQEGNAHPNKTALPNDKVGPAIANLCDAVSHTDGPIVA